MELNRRAIVLIDTHSPRALAEEEERHAGGVCEDRWSDPSIYYSVPYIPFLSMCYNNINVDFQKKRIFRNKRVFFRLSEKNWRLICHFPHLTIRTLCNGNDDNNNNNINLLDLWMAWMWNCWINLSGKSCFTPQKTKLKQIEKRTLYLSFKTNLEQILYLSLEFFLCFNWHLCMGCDLYF